MSIATKQFYSMNTTVKLEILHPNADSLIEEVYRLVEDFVNRFNTHDSHSELMKVNRAAGRKPVQVSRDLFDLIQIGKQYSLASILNLNVAIGPLVKLWHIGFPDQKKPDNGAIQAALHRIDPHNIELDPLHSTVFLTQPGMELDLSAIAKGYIADRLRDYCLAHEIDRAKFIIGDHVMSLGASPMTSSGKCRVGIHPLNNDPEDLLGVVEIENQALVSSSIYRRTLAVDGQCYHHILDSRTGYPLHTSIAANAIIADSAIDGEIWSMILMRNTPTEATATLNHLPGIEGIIIDLEEHIYLSAGIQHQFQPH